VLAAPTVRAVKVASPCEVALVGTAVVPMTKVGKTTQANFKVSVGALGERACCKRLVLLTLVACHTHHARGRVVAWQLRCHLIHKKSNIACVIACQWPHRGLV